MFNGYNETPLISYNEFNQGRIEKQENVPKWSYGHDAGVQPAQSHLNNRHSEFWSGKSNFLGLQNVVKCNCTGCYSSSENQSYQGDTNRHRPWLPRTFPVLLNSSNESCKLPAYQWDNEFSNQTSCCSDSNIPYVQENGGRYPYYRNYQSKLPESNQPGVITSVKNAEYVKKTKNEMSSRTLESAVQNNPRQPVFCSSAYNLTKRSDGRNYCDTNDKYSNVGSYSVDQHVPRLPVVEPFIKAVPSNLSQNRVPSTGYRNVKENIPQPYINSGFGDARKICTEPTISNDKRDEAFSTGQLQNGAHVDHSHLKRDLHEEEPQKLFFDNCRHPDYFPRSSIQDAMKRNSQILDNKKEYTTNEINQKGMPEQHYNMPRSKYQEMENSKFSHETFYPEEFEKIKSGNRMIENSACFQRIEDAKNESTNIHARLPRSALIFNGPRFDSTQNSFTYQSDSYRNHLQSEFPYQNYNAQVRFEYPAGFQRNDFNQYRATPQQLQSGEQFSVQQNSGFLYSLHCQQSSDKTQQFCGEKNPSSFQSDFQAVENKKINYLEAIRNEEVKKNGTNKISPLRLLRKKKFISVPHESTRASSLDSAPGLDVRKFWSTWAEEEEENLSPSPVVVLDCQNIDPEQIKLLNLYETDPVRTVHFENSNLVIKGSNCTKDCTSQAVPFQQIKTCEESVTIEAKIDEGRNSENEKSVNVEKETQEAENINSMLVSETEIKTPNFESACHVTSSPKPYKKVKSEEENRSKKKPESIDKWTEKKFDFLKRAEESKAAEILRHEEEKKKIFETRQSMQQSLKKIEKREENIVEGDENVPERISSLDENSQSGSPQDECLDTFNLPTSEYRRNKFLDYTDRKVMFNGKDSVHKNVDICPNSSLFNEPNEREIKEKEHVKLECSDEKPGKHSVEALFPSLNTKLKEELDVETDENSKKISDIKFQSPEIKFENENNISKKSRPLVKKPKKKKSDHQPESDERKDKLTVETVSKPTIKFSIQKSHDLKISFRVLNSSKEYPDMDVKSEDVDTKKSAIEDSKNSTELITLKYKSIQRDGDRRQNSDFIRNGRRFRRKKCVLEKKTPVLKIKKSRYIPEKERELLPDENECLNTLKKPYSGNCATSEDFQVQETVDSAKIKLTFKRHKGNFETEYKINSNDIEKVSAPELELVREDFDKELEITKSQKKSWKAKNEELFAETGIDCFKKSSESSSNTESGSENSKTPGESVFEEDSRNCSTCSDYCTAKENFNLKSEVPTFSEFRVDYDTFTLSEERKKHDVIEDFKLDGETSKDDQQQIKFSVTHVINCDDHNGLENNLEESSSPSCNASLGVKLKDSTTLETLRVVKNEAETEGFKKKEIQEVLTDFAESTNSLEIETNHISKKIDRTEILLRIDSNTEALEVKSSCLESSSKIKHSDSFNSSYESEFGKNDTSKNLKIIEDLYDWRGDSLDCDGTDRFDDNLSDKINNREEIPSSCFSPTVLENESYSKNFQKKEAAVKIKKTNEMLLHSESTDETYQVKECVNELKENESSNSFHSESDNIVSSDLELSGTHLKSSVENFVENNITYDISPSSEKNKSFSPTETSPNDVCIPAEFKNLSDISEKLIESTSANRKSPSLLNLETKKTCSSNFELSLESGDDLECVTPSTQKTFEVIESVIAKASNQIFENLSSELGPKRNSSKFLSNFIMESYEVDFSPPLRPDTKSFVSPLENAKPPSVNINNSSEEVHETDANGRKKISELSECSLPLLEETISSETALKDSINSSIDIQSDKLTSKDADGNHYDNSALGIDLSTFQEIIKSQDTKHLSQKTDDLEQLREKFLENILDCTTPSGSNQNITINSVRQTFINDIKPDSTSSSGTELEDGEIIDSSDELVENGCDEKQIASAIQSFKDCVNLNKTQRKKVSFISRNIKRRHSIQPEILSKIKESQNPKLEIRSEKKFSRAKSCPPDIKFSDEVFRRVEETPNIRAEDIPLPIGPPPYSSCLNLKKYLSLKAQIEPVYLEVKEKSEQSIASGQPQNSQKKTSSSDPPFGMSNFQNCLNPSVLEKNGSVPLGIFQRSSKIKFSFSKRSRFSKLSLKSAKGSQSEVSSRATVSESKIQEELEKKKVESSDFKINKKIRMEVSVVADQNLAPKECQIEEMANLSFASKTEEAQNCSEEIKEPQKDSERSTPLLSDDLDEKVEVIDALNNFISDKFYECEDIPTSEDLTNGDDLENEKVNDDKFRNIMQNCLDNAKKFLNVGNLKLFSCSVDDLLELDCQASESALGESEPEKSANHISRDVLLTSCEDTSDDLGLSENVPPPDISMDFVPSFCSDVCSEILPVDNWPYLEEEVPSSPIKLRQDETDLIPSLENDSVNIESENHPLIYPKNGIERSVHEQVVSENNFKGFRRRSLISDEEGLKICSKINAQRRKTIESLTEGSYRRDICGNKNELVKSNNEANKKEKRSLKCRLSLEKLTNKHESNLELKKEKINLENKAKKKNAKSLNYKSPSWQPRVMLFRISKNDFMKSSNTNRVSGSKNLENSSKKEISDNFNDDVPAVKKQKFIFKCENEEGKMEEGNSCSEKLVNLPQLDSIKGSFSAITSTDGDVRSRKSRFRNLHSKGKSTSDKSKGQKSFAQNIRIAEPALVHAETILIKMFKDCNRSLNSPVKSSNDVIWTKNNDEKVKKKTSEVKVSANEDNQNVKSKSEGESDVSITHDKSTKEDLKGDKYCDKSKKFHRDKRREKRKGKEQRKQERHIESKKHSGKSRSRHLWRSSSAKSELKRYKREKCRSTNKKDEKKWKNQKEAGLEGPWSCEVCGFDDVSERVLHIKNHPFHCQSCHLAFKTEAHFISHLTEKHKDIRNQHHCLLCELSFDTQEQYYKHLETREHKHLESVEKNTINTLFTVLTGAPCPVLGLVEMKPEWLPNEAGTVHFYHQATPLSLAIQVRIVRICCAPKFAHRLCSSTTALWDQKYIKHSRELTEELSLSLSYVSYTRRLPSSEINTLNIRELLKKSKSKSLTANQELINKSVNYLNYLFLGECPIM